MESFPRLEDLFADIEATRDRAMVKLTDARRSRAVMLTVDFPDRGRLASLVRGVREEVGVEQVVISALIDTTYYAIVQAVPSPSLEGIEPHHSYCSIVAGTGQAFCVVDALSHPEIAVLPQTTILGIQSWAGVPLHVCGILVGAVCALDTTGSREWTTADEATLYDASRRATSLIDSWAKCGGSLTRLDVEKPPQRSHTVTQRWEPARRTER